MITAMDNMELSPRKRTAPDELDPGTPSRKRARFESGILTLDNEMLDRVEGSRSPAPSQPYTEHSLAETAMTPASTSRRPKRYICDFEGCDKAFDRPIRLETHKRSHTNERPFACMEKGCDKTFLRNEHLTRHMKDKHGDERNYICTYIVTSESGDLPCGKTFNTGTRLRRHIAAHEDKEQTKCQEPGCGKVFRKQETLQRHIKKDHLNEKAFACTHTIMTDSGEFEDCEESFTTVGQLRGHVSRCHSSPRFYCELCPAIEPQEPVVDDWMAGSEEFAQSEGLFRPVFSTHADWQMHIKTVHPPSCPDCGKVCESSKALKAHQDIEHSSLPERQQFRCTWPGCERGFTKAGNLKVHVQNVHAKVRNFICGAFDLSNNPKTVGWNGQGCGTAFGTKSSLEEHVRTQHLGIASKIRPSRLKKKIKNEGDSTPSTLMDIDEISTPTETYEDTNALAMLTGHGYEKSKPIACLVPGCQLRFSKDHDLAPHLELTHGWQIEDVNDAIAERNALINDHFWIGGADELSHASENGLDNQLFDSLNINDVGHGMAAFLEHGGTIAEDRLHQWQNVQIQECPGNFDNTFIDPALNGA
ncbi:transcription factor IIIA-like protein [Acrodontium crateriforme]|uniref:Transcription factor IIIA-like protein n=1 Tax=Acrodontium crateriforme TaxID=150365 RepID=A0AAQ3R7N7_9PEZI|nr:transcription factor IIIA-like protein [Acrodontium crateriforme]